MSKCIIQTNYIKNFKIIVDCFFSYLTSLIFPKLMWHASAGKESKNSSIYDFSLFKQNAIPIKLIKIYAEAKARYSKIIIKLIFNLTSMMILKKSWQKTVQTIPKFNQER
ncbi:hypothetical protein BpHYR1_036139 [Brachionus plicatilis]|uniref:Uncharacterized protein n=1 Tax=Brachionus plicatilis TaxID=10195 RepID=A0A3M7S5V3_BRAPC|nr:hypothetical protein BpHYR1_036139 [Brachionus plicatilis]